VVSGAGSRRGQWLVVLVVGGSTGEWWWFQGGGGPWLAALVGRRGHFYVETGCRWGSL
jgi:hypothetical protein